MKEQMEASVALSACEHPNKRETAEGGNDDATREPDSLVVQIMGMIVNFTITCQHCRQDHYL